MQYGSLKGILSEIDLLTEFFCLLSTEFKFMMPLFTVLVEVAQELMGVVFYYFWL